MIVLFTAIIFLVIGLGLGFMIGYNSYHKNSARPITSYYNIVFDKPSFKK